MADMSEGEEEEVNQDDLDELETPVGQAIKTSNHSKTIEIKRSHVTVLCSFYKNDEDEVLLYLPKLPAITTQPGTSFVEDYAVFPGKASNWYSDTEKKFKTTNKIPPKKKKEFECDTCEWSFDSEQKLKRHEETHTDWGTFACQVCHSLFNHHYNMYHHWRDSCTLVSIKHKDIHDKNSRAAKLRIKVLCVMALDNRAQQFHVTGGAMYLPSDKFLANRFNVNIPEYSKPCHLCSLHVPTKFRECHGDVHRGRYRIDGRIYDEFYCHVCSRIFSKKENLIRHWRFTCEEVIAFTPDEFFLNDDEITALAWLVLQQTVPYEQIFGMTLNSQQMIERWSINHAKSRKQKILLKEYYHFPQEIWPLQTPLNLDLVRDSSQILDQHQQSWKSKQLGMHRVNLLAMCSPDFYATGMAFHQLLTSQPDASDSKSTFRILLRYTIEDTIINTYTFNYKTCPRLRPTHPEYDSDSKSYQCEKCDKLENMMFSNEARYNAHMENFHGSDLHREDNWCILCNRAIYIRSPEEHWENNCVIVEQLIQDTEKRKYVDSKFVNYVKRKVLRKLNIQTVLKTPDGERRLEPRYKGQKPEDYFVNVDGELCERVENQAHEVGYTITNVENMPKARDLIEDELDNAKERYKVQTNPEYYFRPSGAVIVICPHCGGRFHVDLLFQHLHRRHSYPVAIHQTVRNRLAEWRKAKFANTIDLFTNLIGRCDKVPPLLSKSVYDNCLDYNFNNKTYRMFGGDWQEKPTLRSVDLDRPLKIIMGNSNSITADTIVAPEPHENLLQLFPSAEKVVEFENPESEALWLPVDPNIKMKDEKKVDPLTQKPLPRDLLDCQSSIDAAFFGNFRREALSNGVIVNSVADFYRNPFMSSLKQSAYSGTEATFSQAAEIEKIKKALAEDAELQRAKRSRDDYTDSEDEQLEGAGRPRTSKKPESRAGRNARERMHRAKRNKQRIRNAPEAGDYDEAAFGPKKTRLDPSKYSLHSPYLSSVVYERNPNDEMADNIRSLSLSIEYENQKSDFRVSGNKFRQFYKSAMPNAIQAEPKLQSQLNGEDKDTSKTYEEIIGDGPTLNAVVDQDGVAYVGGYIKPADFEVDNRNKFFMTKNGKAKQMQVFSSEDKYGEFKYVWPDETVSNITEKKDLKLARVNLVPFNKPDPRSMSVRREEPSTAPREMSDMSEDEEDLQLMSPRSSN